MRVNNIGKNSQNFVNPVNPVGKLLVTLEITGNNII
jgi:hypothetical protein